MDLIPSLVIGLVAGVLALFAVYRTVPDDAMGWVVALVVGVVGGIVGNWLAGLLGLATVGWLGALVVAFAGAALLLWLLQRTTSPRR